MPRPRCVVVALQIPDRVIGSCARGDDKGVELNRFRGAIDGDGLGSGIKGCSSIPIPKILDWSNDASNAIGSEYIIMEHAVGIQLHQKWPTMAGDQQIRCIDAIYRKVKEMVDIKFPAYGSLYFDDISARLCFHAAFQSEILHRAPLWH